jgi:invasion protein IalB
MSAFAQSKPTPTKNDKMGKPITQFGDWAVFTGVSGKGKLCYAAAQPTETQPKGLKRDPAFIFITTNPAQKINNDFSVKSGFAMKKESEATLKIEAASFPLFTKEEGAWVKLPTDEAKVIAAMRAGSSLTVKAISARGNEVTDTYSLRGLSQALDKVASECK